MTKLNAEQEERFYEGPAHWNLWELELRWEAVDDAQWQLAWEVGAA